jgi:hypothetical protein
MPNGLLLLVRLAISLSIAAAMVWIGWKLGGKPWALIGAVLGAPVVGSSIARPVVELFHEGIGWLAEQPLKEWHGSYYEFNAIQVRVYEDQGQLWFAAADVMRAANLPRIPDSVLGVSSGECRRIPGTRLMGLSLAGLERMLAGRGLPESGRLLLWAQREVVAPWEKKRERLARPPVTPG